MSATSPDRFAEGASAATPSPALSLQQLASAAQEDAARQMGVCNACRYCEGLCAVFPAMELRRTFGPGDVDYLANLCHNCGACHYDCQYAPPHPFAINVPVAMAELRDETYARYAWPDVLAPLFERNGMAIAFASALAVALFIGGFVWAADPDALWATGTEPGAFYRVMPHNWMVAIFGAAFLYAILAIVMSVVAFWRASGPVDALSPASLWRATVDASTMRYLDGGGMGCMNESERPTDRRRLWHHLTMYGFLLCFASTTSGTIAHYGFGWIAPYPWWSPTVVLGFVGGLGLIAGPAGLLWEKGRRDPAIRRTRSDGGMAEAFLWMLLLVSATGLLLLFVRSTSLMGITLAIHLGVVFAFFLSMPYGKFVHGLHRFAALVRHAHEQREARGTVATPLPASQAVAPASPARTG